MKKNYCIDGHENEAVETMVWNNSCQQSWKILVTFFFNFKHWGILNNEYNNCFMKKATVKEKKCFLNNN